MFESSGLPRGATKAQLSDALWNREGNKFHSQPQASTCRYVLDGGGLLQRVVWTKGDTYEHIMNNYSEHIRKHYGQDTIIVFDGYATPSIQDMAHTRRNKNPGPTVSFELNMICKLKKQDFPSNRALENDGYTVHYDTGDADYLIVMKAIESAQTKNAMLVGDDADLLALLLYHAELTGYDLFLKPVAKSTKGQKVWNIRKTKVALKETICMHILFIHAMLGCDSTSRLYGIGKAAFLKKSILDNPLFSNAAETFLQQSTRDDVVLDGEKAILMVYGGIQENTLDQLRHTKFHSRTATSIAAVQLSSLPPTLAAMMYHSTRVYYQVQVWKGN